MRILVTGSEGFIGKGLADALRRRGHKVSGFDRVRGQDILNQRQVEDAVKGADTVYHLAAQMDESAKDLFEINVKGTRNLLDACARERVQQFVFLSTVGVMGDIKRGEKACEKTQIKPVTRYEKSKADAEKLVLDYQEALPVTVVRSALVLGPNRYWKDIVKHITHSFPLVGSGENTWQIVYHVDLVDALVFLLGKDDAVGEIFIVAEEKGMTLRKLYDEVRRQEGITDATKTISPLTARAVAWIYSTKAMFSKKRTIIVPSHIDRLLRERSYNTGKVNSLGWKAKYSTREAIRETLKRLRESTAE